jgi:septal ring factor EnvC (AmiA/AmiB activator)
MRAGRKQLQMTWIRMSGRMSWICLALLLFLPANAAKAGVIDRIKDIYSLPEQVGQLQHQYEEAVQQLDQSRKQMEEALARSEEAAKRFQDTQDKLLRENEELRGRNAQLEVALGELEEARQAQMVRNRQIAWTALTAGILALLYFALTRLFRFALWRRGRRGIPGGPK